MLRAAACVKAIVEKSSVNSASESKAGTTMPFPPIRTSGYVRIARKYARRAPNVTYTTGSMPGERGLDRSKTTLFPLLVQVQTCCSPHMRICLNNLLFNLSSHPPISVSTCLRSTRSLRLLKVCLEGDPLLSLWLFNTHIKQPFLVSPFHF